MNTCSKILKPGISHCGYLGVILCDNDNKKRFLVHRLVATAFILNPNGKPQVNHIDGNKLNNLISNLEWVTASENNKHAYNIGLAKLGEEHGRAKLTNGQVIYIRNNPDNLSGKSLAEKFGVDAKTISDVQRGRKYRNVGGQIRDNRVVPTNIREEIKRLYKRGIKGYGCEALARGCW